MGLRTDFVCSYGFQIVYALCMENSGDSHSQWKVRIAYPTEREKNIERHCKTSNRNEERNVVSVRKPSEYIHFYTSF